MEDADQDFAAAEPDFAAPPSTTAEPDVNRHTEGAIDLGAGA
ncbi:hypothetical protein [Sorangium sp. So ce854]